MDATRISTPQGTASAKATGRPKTSAQPDSAALDRADADSFSSLLATLDNASIPAMVESTDVALEAVADTPGQMDPATLAALQGLLAAGMNLVLGQEGQPAELPPEIAKSASSSLKTPISMSPGGLFAVANSPSGGLLPVANDGLIAQTARLDGAADLKDNNPFGLAAGGGPRGFTRFAVGPGGSGRTEFLGGVAGGPPGTRSVRADAMQAGTSADTMALAGVMTRLPADTAPSLLGSVRNMAELGVVSVTGNPLSISDAGIPDDATASFRDSSTDRQADDGAPGAWSAGRFDALTPDAAATVDGTSGFDSSMQPGAEERVADHVAYWANQKTQNAEVTLNQDGDPVQVTVSLTGNEAHVNFRSDQEHTRALLDQSIGQLGELLKGEGLVLAGMTVGTSVRDQNDAGGGQRQRGRPDEPRGGVMTSVSAVTGDSSVRSVVSDRAVDIFV